MSRGFNQIHFLELVHRARTGTRVVLACILANVILAAVKIAAGVLGHSYALIADGIESVTDIFSSAAVLGGFRIGARPPDHNHPFGHGRAESISAFIVSLMVCGAGLLIAVHSARGIIDPGRVPAAFTLYILVGVVVVKELMFRVLSKTGNEMDNLAMVGDAWHNRGDALTSLAAIIGISIAVVGGEPYARADNYAALFASGVILWNGAGLLKAALAELMDEKVDLEFEQALRELAGRVPGVRGVETCRIRKSGSGFFVELHVEVDGRISVDEGHNIGHDVKAVMMQDHPRVIDVVVHIEPHPDQHRSAM